jgi:hypothetical protein
MKAIVDPTRLAFRMKVKWFEDILAHPEARRYLWSLYIAGEAYEELHPDGIFVERLPEGSPLRRQLAKHLRDETRHAAIFRALLREEGSVPAPLEPREDIGWHLLTNVVPDVVALARAGSAFDRRSTMRYFAFLHTLELRSIGDLCALLEAARRRSETALVSRLETILPDERFHATYTHRGVLALSGSRKEARAALDEARRGERRFLRESVLAILARFEALGTAPRSRTGRFRWWLMRQMARLGAALPLLPIYERVPDRVTPDVKGRAA